ncbi:DBF4-type zinc finger-containing protein 2 isoform X2 [Scophthalmus maximus]|uniref:DBF4-type zinc finger-containing protein 2 isoform X2 n=1 Tax=Scophthalmus maximus TaxID=52904 RepID=UPI001FA89446|nr:DBF4-type zinc finger-containing protein 2 isoform X2 [Scophthalmus maximus]XP_035494697.2 DBF4-type zinc finger-containing protein 2 isoform X2 [Scophthalmus maximus]
MSHSSDGGDQSLAGSSSRMWAEPQPSRQGYCGYCRVLYSDLDQHLSSLRHLDSVRTSRGSGVADESRRSNLTLLERFLQDVLQHHPNRYSDPRPSHADLPSVSSPPLPRPELDELRFFDDDSPLLGNREQLPSSDDTMRSRSGAIQDRQEDIGTAPTGHTHSPHYQAPPSVHRKAHRKTNRRKTSETSCSSPRPPTDSLDGTIEEVIQKCCHGVTSTSCQQEETDSFHFSLPVSMESQSDDWDGPVEERLRSSLTPVHQGGGRDLSRLMDGQVELESQVYSHQLDAALAGGGARYIPESFRGKTWAQIEQEDEEKVEKLVGQFRRGRFICYFDSESLARYGRRGHITKGRVESQEAGPDSDDYESAYRRRRRKGRGFRLASRCQVVKVSHSTQTVRLVVPEVRQPPQETPATSIPAANQDVAERTPEVQMWRCLPPSYSHIITPVQPRTSLVYLLCSPSGSAPSCTPSPSSAPKRCRKKRRPLDLQGVKVKYKRLPVRFYDTSTNRILKNPPKGFLRRQGPAPSGPAPPCVRQLFRSLSPDLNTDKPQGDGGGKNHTSNFLLSTLSRDAADKQETVQRRGRTSKAPPPQRRKEGTHPPTSKRRTRAQATPPQPRREGLRRTVPAPRTPSPPRRGRTRRGRSCERGRR